MTIINDDMGQGVKNERLAKRIARAGLCSRRDAEQLILQGRVVVNNEKILTPAFNVNDQDQIMVDGKNITQDITPRVWLYHKPQGLITTHKDPQGRPTVFENLPSHLPRVVSVGRLDLNSEGLLILTNSPAIAHYAEKPATGWKRVYRVRAFGSVRQRDLDTLMDGIEVEGIVYGPIKARLELSREQSMNFWIKMELMEGKNREIRNVLRALGLHVNRLIRTSYGPFELQDIPLGDLKEVPAHQVKRIFGEVIQF